MIRISIDLIPHGIESKKKSLYTVEVSNLGERHSFIDNEEKKYKYQVETINHNGKKDDHGAIVTMDRTKGTLALLKRVFIALIRKGVIRD